MSNSKLPSGGSFNWSDLYTRMKQVREQVSDDPLAQIDNRINATKQLQSDSRKANVRNLQKQSLIIAPSEKSVSVGEILDTNNPITRSEIKFLDEDSKYINRIDNHVFTRDYKRNSSTKSVEGYADQIKIPGTDLSIKSSYDSVSKEKEILLLNNASDEKYYHGIIPLDGISKDSKKYIDIPYFDDNLGFASTKRKLFLAEKTGENSNHKMIAGDYNIEINSGNIVISNKDSKELLFVQDLNGDNVIFYPKELSSKNIIDKKIESSKGMDDLVQKTLIEEKKQINLLLSQLNQENARAITVDVNGENKTFSREELEEKLAENESRQMLYTQISLAKQTVISGLNPITNIDSSAAVAVNKDQVPAIVSSSGGLVSIYRPDESSLKKIGEI